MLILSKFHDYYDTAIAYGIDKTCVYNRKVEIIEIDYGSCRLTDSNSWYRRRNTELFIDQFIIGFAGNIYPVIKVVENDGTVHAKDLFFYNKEEATEYLTEKKLINTKFYHNFGSGPFDVRNKKDLIQFFNVKNWSFLEQNFLKHNTPIFIYKGRDRSDDDLTTDWKWINRLDINCNLKDYKFYKIKDSYTAFQDIYMYKAGVLGNTEVDTIQIDDKVMAQQKGFDKHSFKTMKGDKKPRAKNRGKK